MKVAENSRVCPLCQNALTSFDHEKVENTYPKIVFDTRIFQIIARAFIFFSVILAGVLMLINYLTFSGVFWSAISTASVGYAIVTLKYSIQNNMNIAAKIFIQTFGAMAMVLIIDFVFGYSGWSVNYAIPGLIMLADASILVLMLVNFMNWQSYLLFQIELIASSIILVILYFVGVVSRPILVFVAAGITLLLWLGTMIFGDRKAKNELKRRFHI